ncbi:MAG: hypothetical protein WC203_07735 [Candidatus Bathyarchaeia archaeon]
MFMTTESSVCIFSLTDKDIPKAKDMDNAVEWLKNKGENPHYLRFSKPEGVIKESKVLFLFNSRIFGEATVKESPVALESTEQKQLKQSEDILYRYKMKFYGHTIKIYKYHPTKDEVTDKLKIKFTRLYTYLTSKQYKDLLKMAKM